MELGQSFAQTAHAVVPFRSSGVRLIQHGEPRIAPAIHLSHPAIQAEQEISSPVTLVLNWDAEMKK